MKFSTKGVLTEITRESVLKHINEYSIWCYYTGLDIKLGKKYLSPVRHEKDPSAVFFVASNGSILLKDFGGETWNLWRYLKYRNTSLLNVLQDFGVLGYQMKEKSSLMTPNAVQKHFKIPEGITASIRVKRKRWNYTELQFWKDYHISKETLDFYHVSPLKCYWISKDNDYQEYCVEKDQLLFVFSFGNAHYKIYRPQGDKKKNKWYSNTPKEVLMGFDQLPWVGDKLLITKGMKELCVLKELNIPAVALQGETSYPNVEFMNKLKLRFESIYCLMDSDTAGTRANNYMELKYGTKTIHLPSTYKDLADYCKNEGLALTNELIKQQL